MMVLLDHQLLYSAHLLLNGANVHHLRGLIFAYQVAADLCARQGPKHETYRIQTEVELRNYVHEQQAEITTSIGTVTRAAFSERTVRR